MFPVPRLQCDLRQWTVLAACEYDRLGQFCGRGREPRGITVKYWEVWNEPNSPNMWMGTTAIMVTMAQHAYNIVKSINPDAVVTSSSRKASTPTSGSLPIFRAEAPHTPMFMPFMDT
jgi:hypothetical protein